MRARTLVRRAVTLVAALLPFVAQPFEWSGRVGLDYTRDDHWTTDGVRTAYPRLDLNLALNLRGFVQRPDVVTYSAGVQYQRLDQDLPHEKRVQDQLTYNAKLSLFNGPRNPVQLDLFASRSDQSIDFGVGDLSTVSTIFGGAARYTAPNRPALSLGYTRLQTEQAGSLVADSTRTIQTVTGGLLQGTGVYSFGAGYVGNFSEGSYAVENYDDHRVTLTGLANVTPAWTVTLQDTFYRRQPTPTATFNPRQEYNNFGSTVRNRISDTDSHRFGYQYGHGLQDTPTGAVLERSNHALDYQFHHTFSDPRWRVVAVADLTQQENRLGGGEETFSAETASSTLYWRRTDLPGFLEIRGGPSLGAVQSVGADPFFGFGLAAGTTYERRSAPVTWRVGYDVSFRNDLRAKGQALGQRATASADAPVLAGVLSGLFQAASSRIDSPLLGARASRNLTATGNYRWSIFAAGVSAGLSDSVNPSLDAELMGDGLLIAPYDTHSRFVNFTGSAAVSRSTRLKGLVRLSSADSPGRPTASGTEARAGVEWTFGALRLSIEDRYTLTEVEGQTARVNQLFVRLQRLFGSGH